MTTRQSDYWDSNRKYNTYFICFLLHIFPSEIVILLHHIIILWQPFQFFFFFFGIYLKNLASILNLVQKWAKNENVLRVDMKIIDVITRLFDEYNKIMQFTVKVNGINSLMHGVCITYRNNEGGCAIRYLQPV